MINGILNGVVVRGGIDCNNQGNRDQKRGHSAARKYDDVTPIDSISNIGSRPRTKFSRRSRGSNASSVSSARAKAAAKRAVLEAEAANLESFQAIQKEELSLQQRKKAFELTTEIAKAQAEEKAYAEAEACSGVKFQTPSNSAKEMKPSDNRTPHPVEEKIPFSWSNQQRLATASSGVDSDPKPRELGRAHQNR